MSKTDPAPTFTFTNLNAWLTPGSGKTQPAEQEIALDLIDIPSWQSRKYIDPDALNSLAESIKKHTLIEPILLRPIGDRFELVLGQRRLLASRIAGKETIRSQVWELSEKEAQEISMVENLQREDLNPVEETEGILILLASHLNLGQSEVIALLRRITRNQNKSGDNVVPTPEAEQLEAMFKVIGRFSVESFRTHRLPLLNLPEDVLEALRQGKIHYTKGRAIARIKDDSLRARVLTEAIEQGLSLSEIKRRITEASSLPQENTQNLSGRMKTVLGLLNKNGSFDDPKKAKKIESLLAQLEKLV